MCGFLGFGSRDRERIENPSQKQNQVCDQKNLRRGQKRAVQCLF